MQTLDHEQQVLSERQDRAELEIEICTDRESSRPRVSRATHAGVVLRWSAALLLLGAAGIHFGVMGQHAGVSWTHGLFFAVAAWGQVALAGLLILKPTRLVIVGTVLATSAIIGVWIVSKTVGIAIGGDGTPDPVKFIDALCTVFEAIAVVLCLLVLARGMARRPVSASTAWGAMGLTGLIVAALTSFGFSPALADGGGDGHSHAGAAGALAATGHVHGVAGVGQHSHNADEVAELAPDKPLDNATRDKVAQQLTAAREFALQYPTVADAQRAGMILAGGFAPGVGAHYIPFAYAARGSSPTGDIDPRMPGSVIYDGTSPTSRIVGLMYLSMAGKAPEGFAGPNDHWHRHSNTCVVFGAGMIQVPFPADSDVTRAMCDRYHGTFMKKTVYMVHAWVVPGWESPLGVFSHNNPNLHCADGTDKADKIGFCQGT